MNDEQILRKFAAGYSVRGIAKEAGLDYAEVEMRLRAVMVGMQLAVVGRCAEDCGFCQDANRAIW